MLTRKECLDLLKNAGIKGGTLRHSLGVNKVAIFIAKKLKEEGNKIDIYLVDSASLLHDLGKVLSDNSEKEHWDIGAEILDERGHPLIAQIIKTHSISAILENNLKTIEQKIVFYADKRFDAKVVDLDTRFKGIMQRHPESKETLLKSKIKTKELEKEMFGDIEIPENI